MNQPTSCAEVCGMANFCVGTSVTCVSVCASWLLDCVRSASVSTDRIVCLCTLSPFRSM